MQPDLAETLAAARMLLADVTSIEEIMGYEGTATREYFRSWQDDFGTDWGFGPVSAAHRPIR